MLNKPAYTHVPTQKAPNPRDRTAALRALLEYPADIDTSADIIKEMARVLVEMDKDLFRVPFMSNQIATFSSQFQDFVEDVLLTRSSREEEDVKVAKEKFEKAVEAGDQEEIEFFRKRFEAARRMAQSTSQKIEAVKLEKTVAATQNVKGEPSFKIWLMANLKDSMKNIINIIVNGTLYFIGNALWAYLKSLLGAP